MSARNEKPIEIKVTFVDFDEQESTPHFAAYQLDPSGKPTRKLGSYDGKLLKLDIGEAKVIAIGPEVENFTTLPKESLTLYRIDQKLEAWRKEGLILAPDNWSRLHLRYACVTGDVKKCRPWYWDILNNFQLAPMFQLAQKTRIKSITSELQPHVNFPLSCYPLCDGIIEIYERTCCCHHVHIPDLIDKLHDILDHLPIPLPDPIPGPDPEPFTPRLLKTKARAIQARKTVFDFSAIPPQNLHQDYLAIRNMSVEDARYYVLERDYLYPLFCHCSVHKVGETFIQPGGYFDYCYLRIPYRHHCTTTYAYKVKQMIDGVWRVVYDGLGAHQYFNTSAPANISVYNPQARICADGPGEAPPNDGLPFVMLEHIGDHGSFHFNFPTQTAVSNVGALDADDGTYTTSYAPDCPWGGGLGLRLWFSPELEPIVKYYRLKVFAVNALGDPVGSVIVLNDTVTWDKFIEVSGDIVRAPETLGPNLVGTENDLFKVPYWSSPNHRYLSGQFHQYWNTAQSKFPDGKYMLAIEVFDGSGNRIKPNGAAGTGTPQSFQFRRWVSSVDTDPVPFADAAHIFWVDNTPVGGDIVDLRKGGVANTEECQYMTGSNSTTFAIGMRAYHVNGVDHAGNGDSNSFMYQYGISWQRGLNGSTGSLGAAPSGGNNHTDVGEIGGAVASGSETFETMLTKTLPDSSTVVLNKCTFSVTLHVAAKHYTGSSRITSYDYWETAAFALEINS